jgi:hypothetical protein
MTRRGWWRWRAAHRRVARGAASVPALAVAVLAALVAVLVGVGVAAVPGWHAPAPAGAQLRAGAATNSAYAVVDAAGGVLTFGGAGYQGDTLNVSLARPIVGAAADAAGGYWLVASDGGVFTFGNAGFFGSTGGLALDKPVVAMAATADGSGYWLVASDGGIFSFGDAGFHGSTGSLHLNKPIVGMAATPDGGGYWLVASDGGIFAFGDAPFLGSAGSMHLNKPVVGMATTGDGRGYWLVASDGGIFTYGDAPFFGSTGSIALNQPIVGMAATPGGSGYWLVAADDGVFTFGDAVFSGSAQSPLHPPLFPQPLSNPIPAAVAIVDDVPGPQAAHQGGVRVAFAGDSLALYEGRYVQDTNPPYLIDDGAAAGCGFTNGAPTTVWSNTRSVFVDPVACALWASQLQWLVARYHPDVTVIQDGFWELQPRLFNGRYATLADSDYSAYIEGNLQQAAAIAHSGGGAVVMSTSPYFQDGTPHDLVDAFNHLLGEVAAQDPFVSIDDLYTVLDPGNQYAIVVDGIVARGSDGVHITQAAVDYLIEPALNQIIANVADPVYNGDT